MPSPATQTVYQFTADGSVTYTIPMWIFSVGDIAVYYVQALQAPAAYSVSAIVSDTSFSLTLAVDPGSGTVTVCRRIQIEDPTNFAPGNSLTAEDLNQRFDASYLIAWDNFFYTARFSNTPADSSQIYPSYGEVSLTYTPADPEYPKAADLVLPVLSTPGPGDAPRVWAKDSAGSIIDAPLDPGGITAAELKAELAAGTSASDSGATLVGYWNGTSLVTVQAGLDAIGDESLIAHYDAPTGMIVIANGLIGDPPLSTDISWIEGSPFPTVPATGLSDVILATRGWVSTNSSGSWSIGATPSSPQYDIGSSLAVWTCEVTVTVAALAANSINLEDHFISMENLTGITTFDGSNGFTVSVSPTIGQCAITTAWADYNTSGLDYGIAISATYTNTAGATASPAGLQGYVLTLTQIT